MTQVLKTTTLALMTAGLLAACTTAPDGTTRGPQPAYPITKPSEPSPPPADEPPPPTARPSGEVESRTLAPPPGATTAPERPAPSQSTLPPIQSRPAAPAYSPPPPPQVQTVTRTSVTGKVVDAAGPPQIHKVGKGDTVYSIARKFDESPDQLAKDNRLKSPYVIHPGQELKGPSSKAKAYVVGSGDTLFAIGRRFGVTVEDLAGANDMDRDAPLRVGQKVVLPDGYKDHGPTTTTVRVPVTPPPSTYSPPPATPTYTPARPSPATPAPAPHSAPPPTPNYPPASRTTPAPSLPPAAPPASKPIAAAPKPAPAPTPAPTPAPSPTPAPPPTPAKPTVQTAPVIVPSTPVATDAQISQLGAGRFVWPLRGAIISDFGPKGTGQRNDGVDIRANAGEPVRAAAAGDVVYAGDQVPGFGNLVLIKHADGWVSAYGHLSRVDVKMQDKVAQGQEVGQAGATGGVAEPQLHFEIRYAPTPADRARPINPLLVLPK